MSILKGIMHHWNKTKNDYDVIHPETDYKKITDWNEGIVATLASTALGTLVSTLTSDSLLATMIQKVLTATGVKYNIAQNGYLCFGSLFGGLIIQWGNVGFDDSKYCDWDLPLSVTSIFQVFATDYDTSKTNGTSIGDIYAATYKPEFSDGSRLRFVTYSNSMGGFSAVAICR